MARATVGPSATPISTPTTRASKASSAWPGARRAGRNFPTATSSTPPIRPTARPSRRCIELATARGIGCSKGRSSQGQNGLASSINLLLPDALATGKLDIVPNAIVREITTDKNTGLANGAHFVDRHSRREMHVKARVVILAAGSLESTRLLLNSGIANSSGVMGHYLIDQIYGIERGGFGSRSARRQSAAGA